MCLILSHLYLETRRVLQIAASVLLRVALAAGVRDQQGLWGERLGGARWDSPGPAGAPLGELAPPIPMHGPSADLEAVWLARPAGQMLLCDAANRKLALFAPPSAHSTLSSAEDQEWSKKSETRGVHRHASKLCNFITR